MHRKVNLEGRMEQYGTMARGQIGPRHTFGEIAGYAAAVGAGLAMAGTADASIVFSGVLNNSVSATASGTVATIGKVVLKGSASNSLNQRRLVHTTNTITPSGSDHVNTITTTSGTDRGMGKIKIASGISFLGTRSNSNLGASRLSKGASITANKTFLAPSAGGAKSVGTSSGVASFTVSAVGKFLPPNSNSGFVGFKLNNGDLGWIQLQVESDSFGVPDGVKVTGWAYNDIAGASILAGQTKTVPDPSSLALLAAGALGLAAFRRRKAARAN